MNSFSKQFVAIIKGNDAEALAAKTWRQAESALKMQIASLEGDLTRVEDAVEDAKEVLCTARVNGGKVINDRNVYVSNLIASKEALVKAEKALEAHIKTITFLKEEYSALKA